jgi:hypothetical protein
MTTPRHSNGFLDSLAYDAASQLEAATASLERLLTDRSEGDSSNGVNPNCRDVHHQIAGDTVDKIRAVFARVDALRQASDPDLTEVRRIRVAQGYRPR